MALTPEQRKKFDFEAAKAAGKSDYEIEEYVYGKKTADDNAKIREQGGTGSFLENLAAGSGKAASDVILGAKQLAASVGMGDSEALSKEAAAKKEMDKKLSGTAGGMIGDYGTQAIMAAAPTGAVVRGAKLLPELKGVAGAVTKAAQFAAPGAAVGAAQGVLTPDENYDPTGQAAVGALSGVGGDVVGRTVGRIVNPAIKMVGKKGMETLARVREAFPNATLNAENLTDNKSIKILTNLLGDTPLVGKGVNKARAQNLGDVTEMYTGNTGNAVREIAPSVTEAAEKRVGDMANKLREGYVPTTGMPQRLMRATDADRLALEVTNTLRPNVRTVGNAAAAVHPGGPPFATGGGPPAGFNPNVNTIAPAEQAMNIRLQMQKPLSEERKGLTDVGAKAVQNEWENALRLAKGNNFDRWLAEHGGTESMRDLTTKAGAVTKGGQVRPEAVQEAFTGLERSNPETPYHKAINAAADRFSTPKDEMSRTLMQRILTGAAIPTLVGAGTGFSTGDWDKGVAAGGATLGLAHLLLGTPGGGRYLTGNNKSWWGKALQSDAIKKYFRSAGITGAVDLAEK
jgi:hypothetical protein